jgi:hypothetical protein
MLKPGGSSFQVDNRGHCRRLFVGATGNFRLCNSITL